MKKGINGIILIIVFVLTLLMQPAAGGASFFAYADTPQISDAVSVSTVAELQAVLDDLNTNGGDAAVKLAADISFGNTHMELSDGSLTVFGEGHTLAASIKVSNDAVLNFGSEGYDGTLTAKSSRSDSGVADLNGTSVLNIYDGTTVGPTAAPGTAGGVVAHSQSVLNMYGGTITDCKSLFSVSGAVYLDGNSVFNMYGGTIKNCTGMQGGAVGLSGAAPIGGSDVSSVEFNMYDGTITECTDNYIGGGAVCAYTAYPVVFRMNGGTISNCKSTSYGYGGAICLYTTSDTTFIMNGGTIEDNINTGSRAGYGGGVFVYAKAKSDIQFNGGTITGNSGKVGGGALAFAGNITFADGFSIHNNSSPGGGDDIYNAGANMSVGEADTSAVLGDCGHAITDWYYDDDRGRWSYEECTGEADCLNLYDHVGEINATEFGLKAAHGEVKYTITYDLDGGALPEGASNPVEYTPATDDFTLVNPVKEGYRFDGWTGTGLDAATETVTVVKGSTGDRSYKANWTPNSYVVKFDPNGGTAGSMDDQSFDYDEEKSLKVNAFTRAGYSFTGWNTVKSPSDADPGTAYTDEQVVKNLTAEDGGSITLYAQWKANDDTKYTVEYYYQSEGQYPAAATSADDSRRGTTDTQAEVSEADKTPARDGYVFDGSAANVLSGNIAGDGSLVLKVHFKQQFSVEYKKGDHGTFEDRKHEGLDYNSDTPAAPATTGDAGYAFAGWINDAAGKVEEIAAKVVSDLRYTASWDAEKYTIVYDLDGGALEDGMSNPGSYTVETDDFALNNPVRNGYRFDGWTGTGLDAATAAVTVAKGSTGDRSYKANWTPIQYRINFDSAGGSNVPGQDIDQDGIADIPADPVRPGYVFKGWMLNGKLYDFNTPVTGPITLVALWEEVSTEPDEPADQETPEEPSEPEEQDEAEEPVTPATPAETDEQDDEEPAAIVTPDDDDDTPTTTPRRRQARPAGTAAAPARGGAPARVAVAGDAEVEDGTVPQAEPQTEPQTEAEVIPEQETPLAEEPEEKTWALLNLIAAVLTVVGALLALRRRLEDDDEDNPEDDDEDTAARRRRLKIAKAVGLAIAATSLIVFILTENITLRMALIDKWTILMLILLAAQIAAAVVAKKIADGDDEEDYEYEDYSEVSPE